MAYGFLTFFLERPVWDVYRAVLVLLIAVYVVHEGVFLDPRQVPVVYRAGQVAHREVLVVHKVVFVDTRLVSMAYRPVLVDL